MIRVPLFLVVMVLAACSGGSDRKRDTGAASGSDGTLNFRSTTGKGVTEEPSNTFHIPACGDGRKLGYITAPWRTPLPAGATFTVGFVVTASAGAQIVGYEDGSVPANAALHFQRDSHDSSDRYALDVKYYDRGYRQWSHPSREKLTPGGHVFSEVLRADRWTHPKGFDKALADPAYAGITLSGTGSAGHGVCMTAGTAAVTITGMNVQ